MHAETGQINIPEEIGNLTGIEGFHNGCFGTGYIAEAGKHKSAAINIKRKTLTGTAATGKALCHTTHGHATVMQPQPGESLPEIKIERPEDLPNAEKGFCRRMITRTGRSGNVVIDPHPVVGIGHEVLKAGCVPELFYKTPFFIVERVGLYGFQIAQITKHLGGIGQRHIYLVEIVEDDISPKHKR